MERLKFCRRFKHGGSCVFDSVETWAYFKHQSNNNYFWKPELGKLFNWKLSKLMRSPYAKKNGYTICYGCEKMANLLAELRPTLREYLEQAVALGDFYADNWFIKEALENCE